MPNPTRELITLDELNKKLTAELRIIPEFKDAQRKAQYLFEKPDADGCNWSPNPSVNPGSNGSLVTAQPHVERIVRGARARYNIKK